MYGTHTLAFERIFVRMKIISLISIRFSYVSLIRNSVTGPLERASLMASVYVIRCSEFQNINFKRPMAQFQYPTLLVGFGSHLDKSMVFQSHATLQNKFSSNRSTVFG
jgi:hypothetical protein